MTRNEIDKIFELCLLLVTVIGAAELQYASFYFSPSTDRSNVIMVNSIFRWTTFTIFILIFLWIISIFTPSMAIKNRVLAKIFKRRKLKEFCWSLFGNLFLWEIIYFFSISYSASSPLSGLNIATIVTLAFVIYTAFLLTLYATWRYRKDDIYEMQNQPLRSSILSAISEHTIIYFSTLVLMMIIWGLSLTIPPP